MHANAGPFMMVEAAAEGGTQAPSVNSVHTHYTLTLPGGAPGAYTGTARYRPQRTGEWVFFMEAELPLKVFDAMGAELPVLYTERQTSCDKLPFAHSFALMAGTTYELRFGPAQGPEAAIVIEKADDFVQTYFADVDGDGQGDPESTLVTSCVPPKGVIDNDTDCDDKRAESNIDAAESCDQLDNDCDMRVDEGLTCGASQTTADAGMTTKGAAASGADAGRPERASPTAGRSEARSDAGSRDRAAADAGERETNVRAELRDADVQPDASSDDIMAEAAANGESTSGNNESGGGCQVVAAGAASSRAGAHLPWLIALLLAAWHSRAAVRGTMCAYRSASRMRCCAAAESHRGSA
jgi:hypothetical protein